MACETIGDNCPRPGDTDNILLRKILLALTSGDGVAGGNGIVETPGGVVNFAQSGPYTPGAIPFATGPTTMGFDPTHLFWDDVNNWLGIGTNIPTHPLTVNGVPLLGTAKFNVFGGASVIFDTVVADDSRNEYRRLGVRIGGLAWDTGRITLFSDSTLHLDSTNLLLDTTGVSRWSLTTAGHFLAFAHNTYDIGASANAPRDIYAGTRVFTPQVQFPAVQVPSADPNNLDDYQEGAWTPIDGSGAGLAFTIVAADCTYTKIGRKVVASFRLVYPVTASGLGVAIGGLPFTSAASDGMGGYVSFSNAGLAAFTFAVSAGNTTFVAFFFTGAQLANSQLSTSDLRGTIVYHV